MTDATLTLPLKLYRNQRAEDIQNEIARQIGLLTPEGADKPHRIIDAAMNIERLRGQADVLALLEREFYQIVHWGVSQLWTMQQVLLVQYDTVAGLALQHPDDSSSGRFGDAKRAYNDGRREVLWHVARLLSQSQWFPGNELAPLNAAN